jgi:nucleoside-diphosphate-sugar epimerase
MSRIIVTGASGRLGTSLVAALRDGGHQVTGIDRREKERDPDHVVADFSLPGQLDGVFRPDDILVHSASVHGYSGPSDPSTVVSAPTHVDDETYLSLNIVGSWHVIAAAAAAGIRRVVLTSSCAAGELPIEELSRLGTGREHYPEGFVKPRDSAPAVRPYGLYAVSEWFQEGTVQSFANTHDLSAVILRPPAFIAMDPALLGYALATGSLAIDDVVAAHVAAVDAFVTGRLGQPRKVDVPNVTNDLPYVVGDESLLNSADPLALFEKYWPGSATWFRERGITTSSWSPPLIYDIETARQRIGWVPRLTFAAWWQQNRAISSDATPTAVIPA